MTTYYVDPSIASPGSGLTPETAYKYLSSLPATGSHTFCLRADGLLHRPAATIPTNLTTANIALRLRQSVLVTTYGTGNPNVSGAVQWTGSVGSQSLNALTCKVFDQGVAVNPFWFPRSDRVPTYPSICAPTANDAVDQFIESPADFDNIQFGMAGFYYPGTASWGGNTDPTKAVYYTGSSGSYTVTIRAPGFWARAAAEASLVGARVVMRTGQNYTNFFPTITAYDAIDGSVTISSDEVPYNPSIDGFFFALVGHQYGLRQLTQYAMLEGDLGWVAAMADGSVYDIACYSTVFTSLDGNVELDETKTWNVEALAHGNRGTQGGALFWIEDGNANVVDDLFVGPIYAQQIRNYSREGAIVSVTGNGSARNIIAAGITQIDCMGVRVVSSFGGGLSGASGGPLTVTGPVLSMEGAGVLRSTGAGSGATISDVVAAPRSSVHDNGGTIYGNVKDVNWDGIVFVGFVNPFATEWTSVSGGDVTNTNRHVTNFWFSGRPYIDLSGWLTLSIMSHRDGGTGALYDRGMAVGGQRTYFAQATGKPNTGMIVQRSVIDNITGLIAASQNMSGITFRHSVFTGKLSAANAYPSIVDYLEALGATVENCLESDYTFAGTITDDMWKKLTLNDAFGGYEAIDPWLAPQLGLTLPAYGAARTLVAPAFVHIPFRAGQPAGSMYGAFINPNPLAEMSLPAGQGDNGKLESSLYAGYNVIPSVPCPDQATFTVVLDVTDSGATNGPTQRFSYEITIGASGGSPPPDPEPPPVIITTGSLLRLRLF